MALHNGLDTVGIVSCGVWTKNYGSAQGANIASLFISYGLVEEFAAPVPKDFLGNMLAVGHRGIRFLGAMLRIGR